MEKLRHFSRWFYLGVLAILVLAVLSGCKPDYDRLDNVKGKVELIVSFKILPFVYQFSPDMTKVIFAFSEDDKEKIGFINLEGSKRRYELFSDCECGKARNARWLDETFLIAEGACRQCNLVVDSRDLTTTRLSGELVTAPIKDELFAQWKAADVLYYLPRFGGHRGWLLIPDETTPHYYDLDLYKNDYVSLMTELGDLLVIVEREVPPKTIPSPDGTMYVHTGMTGQPVKVYSADGEVLAEASPTNSRGSAWAEGWTPDGRGVYITVSYPRFPNEAYPLFLLRLPEK